MRTYRVGVLGLDHWYWATAFIPRLLTSRRATLAAIWEPRDWRLRATKYPAERVAARPEEITDDPDIDVVVSFLPCPASARWLARAARNGKALVCNKPLAMTPAAGLPIVAALRRTRRPSYALEGGAALTRRARFIRRLVRQNAIGRPLTGFASMRGGMPMAWWDRGGKTGRAHWGWWTDPRLVPGGAWIDHAIYALPEFGFMLGDVPRRVGATMANLAHRAAMPGLEDYGLATYVYGRGTVVTMEYDWIGRMGSFHSLVGTQGALRWGHGVEQGCIELMTGKGKKLLKIPAGREESVLEHLVRCLDERRETVSPASSGLANLRAALAAYRSARLRRAVSV